ncbi:MAG: pullulanase [Bacteroidia bacterium]|nr:pullulanase [Bacteroidia bacterium]MCF8427009.1 pullulanase [Bacteroidia bacterium]
MRFYLALILSFLTSPLFTFAQSQADWLSGYFQKNDSLCFLFSEDIYQIKPQGVLVTGAFRSWSQDLKDPNYQLNKVDNGLWKLCIYNPNNEKIKPSMPFKFRTQDGKWMDPPKSAPNLEGGNLVYMKGFEPLSINPGITADGKIMVIIKGAKNLPNIDFKANSFLLKNAAGEAMSFNQMESDRSYTLQDVNDKKLTPSNAPIYITLTPEKSIDRRRVYYLEIPELKEKILCSWEPWFKTIKSDKELGANISGDGKSTSFRVFSPRATELKLYLYKNKDQKEADEIIAMKSDEMGVWEAFVPKNLEGYWYDFTVHGFNDPGNSFFETNPVHVSDPYARVSDDSFGKCRVAHKTNPAKPLKNGRPKMEQVMAYEVHVQDFTDLLPIDESLKGTIAGMGVSGLKNSLGQPIGFDYLTKLGINTVHLMPVQEMLHWPKDEWETAFKNDPYMIEQGVATENYDWGYRTSHSFAIESRYRQKGTEPGSEREQFRDLVQKFHENNMAVIVDFVFNHTAENMDGRSYLFHFNAFDKQYYYRTKNLEHIGEYGNETKSENRYMTQRWIIDQCKHFIEEFGVDGFRIDLAGQTDKETLLLLKSELPKDIIIYGEPWIDSNDPEYNKNPNWHWYKEDAPICYFNDDARNTYKGPVFELNSKETDRGWAGGNALLRDDVKKGLTCTFPTQKNINSAVNYLDIHDNFALADQFATYGFDGRFGVDEINYKIAATLLLTTPGPLVINGGSEFMRSKGLAPLREVEKEIPSGKIYFHGKRDTYNMRNANQFIWENIGKKLNPEKAPNRNEPYQNADYQNMLNYWKGLLEIRKKYLLPLPAFNSSTTNPELFSNLAYVFVEPKDEHMLGYFIQGRVFVMLNTGSKMQELEIEFPIGKWKLIGNSNEIALKAKFAQYYETVMGGKRKYIVQPYSINIWVRE